MSVIITQTIGTSTVMEHEEDNFMLEEMRTSVDPSTLKLTKWKVEPSVADIKEDLVAASSDHSANVARIDRYLDLLYTRGSALPKTRKGRSSVQPKLIRKQAEWRYSSLSEPFLSADNLFDAEPFTYEDRDAARQNALILNHQFNKRINKVKFINEFVRTAVNEGTVIMKLGWVYKDVEIEEELPIYDMVEDASPEGLQFIEQIIAEYESDPISFENHAENHIKEALQLTIQLGVPVIPMDTGETELVTRTKVIANHPTVEVCDYHNVIIDPSCQGDIDKANFVIYSFESSLAQLKEAGIYKNLDHILVNNESILSTPDTYNRNDRDSSFNFKDKLRKRIIVREYWGFRDIDGSGILTAIVASFVGDVMIRLEKNPFPDQKLPFVTVPYLPKARDIYGDPDAELLEDNQAIIGATMRGMIDIMGRSANGQQAVRKDALDVTNYQRFINGEDYEFNPGMHPNEVFYTHTWPEIPNSAQLMLQLQNNDAEALTGVKAFSNGISGQALGNTATGVRSALDATAKRDLDILRRLSKGLEQVGRKIISMNAEFLEEKEVIRITNEEFVTIDRNDLAGNFDIKLSISTAESDNQKAEELSFLLQTIGNSVDFGISKLLLTEIAELRKMPTLAKAIEQYEPQPDPLEEHRRQLEIQLLEAQIAQTMANAQQRGSTAMLNEAKVGTEQVKAGNLQSQTSKNVLDFVEQESGVKQERDIEKQQAQAAGNAQLEVIKAMLARQQNQRPSN